jgi:phenylpyruvate tautomerase PptA (4-oxalocrotonate tautomerase family)
VDAPRASERQVTCQLKDGTEENKSEADDGIEKQRRSPLRVLVRDVMEIVTRLSGNPSQGGRTWVILTEAAEGGWGVAGTAFGQQEFKALAEKARAKSLREER